MQSAVAVESVLPSFSRCLPHHAGVFTSSWIGGVFLGLGEYIIRKVPLVKHIYSAAKQVSAAVAPDHEAPNSFR